MGQSRFPKTPEQQAAWASRKRAHPVMVRKLQPGIPGGPTLATDGTRYRRGKDGSLRRIGPK